MFQKNPHLTISNVNLKDPDMESSQGAAAVIANACEAQWGNVSTGEYLHLKNVHVYGDDLSIRSSSNSGGIAAVVNVLDFTISLMPDLIRFHKLYKSACTPLLFCF